MRNKMNSSRASMAIALSLGFLAMTLSAPALAAGRRDSDRGVKGTVVTERPDHSTLPISARSDVVTERLAASIVRKPGASGPWNHTLVRLAYVLSAGIRF